MAGLAAAGCWPWTQLSAMNAAAPRHDRNLILIILRGGMDGLAAAPAIGDPAFAEARGILGTYGKPALPLDSTFALHPALTGLHAMFERAEAGIVHATGLPYRERSHFDAQQVLESGGQRPYALQTGWLGRALGPGTRSLALTTAVPLVLRGRADVDTWAPSVLPEPSTELVQRLARLYADDPSLSQALARASGLRDEAAMASAMATPGPAGVGRASLAALAQKAADFALQPDGPRVLVLEMGGWDTHANQAAPQGPLATNLATLDLALTTLRSRLTSAEAAGAWQRTVVAVVTEFGREVAVNGTQGTDHGTGGVAFLAGGALKGRKVWADWPGLAREQRYEGRDLRITTDLRAVFKSLLVQHLGVAEKHVEQQVFAASADLAMLDLIRS